MDGMKSPVRQRVLADLTARKCSRAGDIAERLGVSSKTVSRALQTLKGQGKVQQRHEPPYTHKSTRMVRWEVVQNSH